MCDELNKYLLVDLSRSNKRNVFTIRSFEENQKELFTEDKDIEHLEAYYTVLRYKDSKNSRGGMLSLDEDMRNSFKDKPLDIVASLILDKHLSRLGGEHDIVLLQIFNAKKDMYLNYPLVEIIKS